MLMALDPAAFARLTQNGVILSEVWSGTLQTQSKDLLFAPTFDVTGFSRI
jgi:hypothetical protein